MGDDETQDTKVNSLVKTIRKRAKGGTVPQETSGTLLAGCLLVTLNPQTVRKLTCLGLCELCLVISFCSILWDSGTMTSLPASYENESLSSSTFIPIPNPHSSYKGTSLQSILTLLPAGVFEARASLECDNLLSGT